MITLKVDTGTVTKYLDTCSKEVSRSIEVALDNTAIAIKDAVVKEMQSVFSEPTRFTLNSLKVTKTKGHNMQASVWFKQPERMAEHYLSPQVEGGTRNLKGFERGIDDKMFVPGQGIKLNASGNVPVSQLKKILSAVKSKHADYVYLPNGSKKGALLPGVYQRYADRRTGLNSKTRKALGSQGIHQKGMKRGRISSIIRARGLRPVLIVGKQTASVKPRLDFYGVAQRTCNEVFDKLFIDDLNRRLPR